MLWKPVTAGEEVFLRVYETMGRHIHLTVNEPLTLDFLVSEHSFQEFTRLSATIEVFIRGLRGAMHLLPGLGHIAPLDFAKRLVREDCVSSTLIGDRKFCEALKQAAQIGSQAKQAPDALASAVKDSSPSCYMCGVTLDRIEGSRNRATVEHLWPLSLGGASIQGNLIAACEDCNTKRGHSVTWAWGPVQSTDYRHKPGTNLEIALRLSLASARLMDHASGLGKGRRLTLKEAALKSMPLFPMIDINDERHRVYFELFDRVRKKV